MSTTTTQPTDMLPKIAWKRQEQINAHGHEILYEAVGHSYDGRWWEGIWEQIEEDKVTISTIAES